jgi:hypothetical protein
MSAKKYVNSDNAKRSLEITKQYTDSRVAGVSTLLNGIDSRLTAVEADIGATSAVLDDVQEEIGTPVNE